MKKMKKIIQIFTGGWNNQIYCADDICHRIETISQKIPIDAVIIGWNLNTSLYEQVGKFLQEKNIDMYLWLPTFSEIGEIPHTKADTLQDFCFVVAAFNEAI